MSQDPKLFKDPYQFNPDRWATDDIHPFTMLPFGFGPRGCWGMLNHNFLLMFQCYTAFRTKVCRSGNESTFISSKLNIIVCFMTSCSSFVILKWSPIFLVRGYHLMV